jgi:hypothetical protein
MYLLGEVSRCAFGASTGGPRLDIFYAYLSIRNAQSGGSNESEEPKLLFTYLLGMELIALCCWGIWGLTG